MDTVGRNKKIIEEYIKNQIQEDITYEQMSLKEYIDPFTCGPDSDIITMFKYSEFLKHKDKKIFVL